MSKKAFDKSYSEESSSFPDLNSELAEITSLSENFEHQEFSTASPDASAGLKSYQGLIIGIGIGVLLTIGANKLIFAQKPSVPSQSPSVTTPATPPAKNVTLASARLSPVQRTLKATGTVAAVEPIDIYSQATGLQIRQVLVDEGDEIKDGQTLVLLDDAVQQAQLNQARAEVAQAEARLDELKAGTRPEIIAQTQEKVKRLKAEREEAIAEWELAKMRVQRNTQLQQEGAIALDLLDGLRNTEKTKQAAVSQAQANLGQAQQELRELENGARPQEIAQASAQLANAKAKSQMMSAQLRDTKITSPVSGKISQRDARVGNVTTNNQKLFTIIENGQLELRLKVPETQLTAVRPGQKVIITSDADRDLRLTGNVREIEPRVDESSRQGIIRVDLGRQPNLKPGMFLRGAIVTDSATSLTIPMAAVLPQPDGSGRVYVVQPDQTVIAKTVKLGEILGQGRLEIVEGLTPQDQVVVKGVAYLNEGDRISANQNE